MHISMRSKQSGLTILGFLFVAAVVVAAAMVGFRVVPSFVEYYAVKQALEETMRSGTADPNNPLPFRKELERRLQTNYVENVKAADVLLTRNGNQVVAEAAWERRLHIVGNASILLEFETTATR